MTTMNISFAIVDIRAQNYNKFEAKGIISAAVLGGAKQELVVGLEKCDWY